MVLAKVGGSGSSAMAAIARARLGQRPHRRPGAKSVVADRAEGRQVKGRVPGGEQRIGHGGSPLPEARRQRRQGPGRAQARRRTTRRSLGASPISGPPAHPRLEPAQQQRQGDRHRQVDQRHHVVGLEIAEVPRRRDLAQLRDVGHAQHATPGSNPSPSPRNRCPSGGRIVRNACGKTMWRNRCQRFRPSAFAASIWPLSTACRPARKISARKAE